MKRIFNLMLMSMIVLVACNGFASTTLAKAVTESGNAVLVVCDDHDTAAVVNCLTGTERKEVFKLSDYACPEIEPLFIEPIMVYHNFLMTSGAEQNKEIKKRNLLVKDNKYLLYLQKFSSRTIS